ncbi:MAG: hypothetical protein IPK50_07780 [Fibrobacterota bacterium]|nr:MAG: hypothetical protein IPK50_07780 [Fibrobacterota bacterium]
MNRPNPVGPHHRRDDREPMLMDISTAKPSGEVNWEAIIAKTQRGKADGSRKTYDTSSYLERVREEDPWPEEAVAKECAVRIVSCRLLDPAPIDLCKPVRVACEVERTGPLDAAESLQISLVTIHREKGCDAEEPCGDSLDVKLEARASQSVNVVFKLDKKEVIGGREPSVQIYLRAQAQDRTGSQKAKSQALPALAEPTTGFRWTLVGSLFDERKSFVLPAAIPGVRKVVERHVSSPRDLMVVVAPVAAGEDSSLALRRAKALAALITNKWEDWLPWFAPEEPAKQRLGLREAQLVLAGLKLFKGQCSGLMDAETEAALRAFQQEPSGKAAPIAVTGKLDSPTRKELLRAYFSQEGTTVAKSCLVRAVTRDRTSDEPTEAVPTLEVLFYTPRLDPEPSADRLEAKAWKAWKECIQGEDRFELHSLRVQVVNDSDIAVPNARVKLSGPVVVESCADDHGWVVLENLPRGKYRLHVFEGDDRVSDPVVEIPATSTEPGVVHRAASPEN